MAGKQEVLRFSALAKRFLRLMSKGGGTTQNSAMGLRGGFPGLGVGVGCLLETRKVSQGD